MLFCFISIKSLFVLYLHLYIVTFPCFSKNCSILKKIFEALEVGLLQQWIACLAIELKFELVVTESHLQYIL